MADTLPAPLTFVSSPDGCTASGRTLTCPGVAQLAVGRSVTWPLHVRLDPAYTGDGTNVRNTATASADNTDPVTANDTSQAVGPPGGVRGAEADLDMTKTARAA